MEQLIGQTLNRYKILELLGKGGLGAVYKAYDTVLQRHVAIKVMHPDYARRPNFRERFLNEARTAARLDHPGIVKVHDFGEEAEDRLYIVMEYIPGDNLRQMLHNLRGQNTWVILSEAVQIVQQVARSLVYAHEHGVLHRDVKPDNLMLKPEPSDGLPYRVVLTDLGLAELTSNEGKPRDGISMGTPAYMSPEQAMGQSTDARSDVYSLGVLLYELAVGKLPYPARTISEAVRFHREVPVPQPRSIREDLPVALETVILRALEKNPDKRFSNTGEMAQALEDVIPAVDEAAFNPSSDIENTVSLITQTMPLELSDTLPAPPTAGAPQAHIEIIWPDQTVRAIPLETPEAIIGRDPENEIVLDHPRVSRKHSKVRFDGRNYYISDMGSMNGTYLANRRLTPGEEKLWLSNQSVQLGTITLRLRYTDQTQPNTQPVAFDQQAQTLPNENIFQPGVGADQAGVFLEPAQLSVIPGTAVTANLVIQNRTATLDQYRIAVEGIPINWLPTPPPIVRVNPGAQREVPLTIQPPYAPSSKPGRYPLTIRVISGNQPNQVTEVRGALTVRPYIQFSADLRPRRILAGEGVMVTVQNQGNASETFTVEMSDHYGDLGFRPPQAHLTLAEGESAAVEFVGEPRQRPLIGGPRANPYSAKVSATNGETRSLNGEVMSSGVIPPVIIPVFLLACLCISAMLVYGLVDGFARPNAARQTAEVQTQVAAATQAALSMANEGTIQAVTATANWLLGDDDRDGLSNEDELRYRTNPNLADTDGDTLTDGYEVNQARCLNPLSADTDNDGLNDKVDPDPCNLFTATPPAPSPVPTMTNTPLPIIITDTPIVIVITTTPVPPTDTLVPPSVTPQVATLTPTPTVPAAGGTPIGGSPLVEFSTGRDGNYEIYAMMGDGSRQTRVTNSPGDDIEPALSADSSRTVFVSNRDGNQEIYVMNADGTGQVRLTSNAASDYSPAWSPDGIHIVFVSERDGNPEIYVMLADGTNQVRLTNNTVRDGHPSYSPDGTRIIFDQTEGDVQDIFIMNSDGSGLAQLTNNAGDNIDPALAPNGSKIAFISNREGNYELYVMNPDGTDPVRITGLGGTVGDPAWSNDSLMIAFSATTTGKSDVYVIRVDGSGLVNLSNTEADDGDPTW